MAARLDEYRRSSLDDLMMAKEAYRSHREFVARTHRRARSRPYHLFMNREALSVLNLTDDVVGRNATDVALSTTCCAGSSGNLRRCEARAREPLKIYADNKESYFQMENVPLYITPIGKTEREFIGNLIILNNITI